MVLNKKDRIYKTKTQVTKKINQLKKIKKKLMIRFSKKKTTDLQRSLRNVRESLSVLKRTRREWRNYIISVKLLYAS